MPVSVRDFVEALATQSQLGHILSQLDDSRQNLDTLKDKIIEVEDKVDQLEEKLDDNQQQLVDMLSSLRRTVIQGRARWSVLFITHLWVSQE